MIYVNMSGSAVAMPFVDKVGAIVQAWYLGSEAGNALADVLTGKVCPSGKLPFTFPCEMADGPLKTVEQYPGVQVAEKRWQSYYTEGIYVGYRWYEAQKVKPLFPFGYGLSYTTFEYGQAIASSKTMGRTLKIKVPVTNTGKVTGAEVVQLYLQDVEASVDRPIKELKGFEKVYLEPGQTRTVEFVIDREDLSFFDADRHEWVVEPGEFKALIAASSDDIRSEVAFVLK
jgi:beta-glucosidase